MPCKHNNAFVCVCFVKLHVTVNYIKILNDGQKCLDGKCVPPATINLLKSPCKVPNAALKQKTFVYPRPSWDVQLNYTESNDRSVTVQFLVFCKLCLTHVTRSGGINQSSNNNFLLIYKKIRPYIVNTIIFCSILKQFEIDVCNKIFYQKTHEFFEAHIGICIHIYNFLLCVTLS